MKSLFFISIIAFSFLNFNIATTYAGSNSENYARITRNQVYLYTLPEDKNENVLFEIPKSYFVELLSQHNDLFYKAKYIDIVGFIKIDDVLPVSTTPQNPYADNIRFRVYSSDGVNIRTEPYIKNGLETIKGSLTVLDENVIYYGKIEGEEAVKNRGTTWYYCKYKTNKESIYGYVYAGFCDMLTQITENEEISTFTNNPFFITQDEIINTQLSSNNTTKNIILTLTIIPTIIFLYLLFKPYKIKNKNPKNKSDLFIKAKTQKNQKLYDDYEL